MHATNNIDGPQDQRNTRILILSNQHLLLLGLELLLLLLLPSLGLPLFTQQPILPLEPSTEIHGGHGGVRRGGAHWDCDDARDPILRTYTYYVFAQNGLRLRHKTIDATNNNKTKIVRLTDASHAIFSTHIMRKNKRENSPDTYLGLPDA